MRSNNNTVSVGTIVGYDFKSGKKLFTEPNRVTRFPDQTLALPHADDLYLSNGKNYRVVGVRAGSTEIAWEIEVREETDPPSSL
jgi:hypothetical protein